MQQQQPHCQKNISTEVVANVPQQNSHLLKKYCSGKGFTLLIRIICINFAGIIFISKNLTF
ncbi:hypothetical protein D3H65_26165 [Paraflavitalea soli]|uniref:Uncharacterized protein n=1 Tax=Paraflavitalea soli TaxID=2315862 RepID=A0A3B7MRT7_9BACT|nr:hypothetical protein D3H65_26165 [Paraflavitalea soli]